MGDAAHVLGTLHEDDIPIKTLQGLKALRIPERSFTIHARTLALLKLADGKRTTREIRALDRGQGDTAEVLAYLHAIGLLEVAGVPAPVLEQPKPPQEATGISARTGYLVHAEADVTAVKRLLVDWAVKALGPDGSVRLAMQVEKTKSRDEALAVLERMCTMFTGGMSHEVIETHRADALRLLGLAPSQP